MGGLSSTRELEGKGHTLAVIILHLPLIGQRRQLAVWGDAAAGTTVSAARFRKQIMQGRPSHVRSAR